MTEQNPPQLDKRSPVPLYYQLQEILRQEFEAGRWKPGDLLPSEARLNEMFDVSRTVTRRALDVLAADGLVYRVKGKGTVVAEPKISYFGVQTARVWRRRSGAPDATLAAVVDSHRVAAGEDLATALDIEPADTVFEITYVLGVDETLASVVHYYFPTSVVPDTTEDTLGLEPGGPDVIVQLADRFGFDVVRSTVVIEASRASGFESELLGMAEGAPIFVLTTIDRAESGRPLGFARTVVRSDLFRFSVELEHGDSQIGAAFFRRPGDMEAVLEQAPER